MLVMRACEQFKARDDDHWKAFLRDTVTAMKDFPADLIATACERVVKGHAFMTIPVTADFVKAVAGELAERKLLLRRLDVLRIKAGQASDERSREPLTAEQQADFDRVMAGLNMRRVPVEPGERTRQTTEAA